MPRPNDLVTNAELVKTRGVRLPSVCSTENALARLQRENARFGIVEANHRFVGLVWTDDLAAACSRPDGRTGRVSSHFDSRAAPVMAFASAMVSARRMIRDGVTAVPVLDGSGSAIGILTIEDFADAFARLRPAHTATRDAFRSMRSSRWGI